MNGLDREDEIVAAYAAGDDVATIEARYGVTQEQIERIVVGGEPRPVRQRGPGMHSKGNRVLLGVAVGFVVQAFAGLLGAAAVGQIVLWAIVAAITYAIATPN